MKRIILLLVFGILCFPCQSYAFSWRDIIQQGDNDWTWSNWDKKEKSLFCSFMIFETVDYGQTRYIFKNDQQYRELNGVIRYAHKKFGRKGILLYFVACPIGSYLIADRASPSWRKGFLTFLNCFQIKVTDDNYSLGIKFDF